MSAFVYHTASGEGVPFVFQHGLGSNVSQPQSLLKGLSGVQLHSIDCSGHGNTPLRLSHIPSFHLYAEEVIRFLDCLKIEKAIFGGISMGAGIATYIALHFPNRVSGLVLIRPAWLDRKNPSNLQILKKAATFIPKKNGKIQFEQTVDFQNISQQLPTAGKSVTGVFASSQQKVIPLVLKKMVGDRPLNNLNELSRIACPSLIIGNDDDPLHPWEMATEMHRYIPNSQLEKVVSRYLQNRHHRSSVQEITANFLSKNKLC